MKQLFLLLIIFSFFNSIAYGQVSGSKPFVLGVIDEMHSAFLSEKRILNIYLPASYHENDTAHYPVIYLLDGSADEDFIHIAGLVQYFNFPWINTLPESIVVGIATVDRRRDFTYPTTIAKDKAAYPTTGGSSRFTAFIEKELQPFIEKKYRCNAGKTIIGQSLGGLLATEILFTRPSLFNTYIIVSPSLWWDNQSLLNAHPAILEPGFNSATRIYIGVGKEGLVPGLSNHIMEADVQMLADKIKQAKNKNLEVFYDYLPEETHATILHPAVFNAFRLLHAAGKDKIAN